MQTQVLRFSCYTLMLLLSASGGIELPRTMMTSSFSVPELPVWVGGLLIHVAVLLVVKALASSGCSQRIPLLHAAVRLLPKFGCLSFQYYARAPLATCCRLRGLLQSLTAGGSYALSPTVPWAVVAGLQVVATSVLYAVRGNGSRRAGRVGPKIR
jgi:hypothetical protein